jgi:adenosylmethionine-8-amino-7-oxononanoate aminotransferase
MKHRHRATAAGAIWNDPSFDSDNEQILAQRGVGHWLYDSHGRRFFEGVSGHSCLNLGYDNDELVAAATEGFRKLSYCSPEHLSQPILDLSDALDQLLGGGYVTKYAATGGGANELAIEIARRHWIHNGQPGKRKIISLDRAYHGSSGYSGFASSFTFSQSHHVERDPEFITVHGARDVEHGLTRDLESLRAELLGLIDHVGAEMIAAIIIEPIGFAGGVIIPPDGYLTMIAEICGPRQILVVVDEIITGFGRSGEWFAHQREKDFRPDLVTVGKGITGGYFPLTGVAVKSEIYEGFLVPRQGLSKVITLAGHPVGCEIALKNIEIMKRDRLIERVRINADFLRAQLSPLGETEGVRDVRGVGHMWGLEFAGKGPSAFQAGRDMATKVESECRSRGLIVLSHDNVTRINPPLSASNDELGFIVDTLKKVLAVPELALG